MDITSKGEFVQTLADRIKGFSNIKLKKASVNVPRLDAKEKAVKQKPGQRKPSNLSSIVNILVKAAIEKVKKAKKAPEEKSYKIVPEERRFAAGGYGAVSRSYGMPQQASYVDYGKIFSYLGKFRAQNPYEHLADEHAAITNKASMDNGFGLASRESMDKIARYTKYIAGGEINILSHAPKAGLTSAEWEKIKLWIQLEPAMYRLKSAIS